jgi:hypothetical protein
MHARLVRLRIQDGEMDRAAAIFEREALPQVRAQRGFVDALFLAHPSGLDAAIVILWREAADSDRLERHGFYRAQIAKFAPVFAAPPSPELYEVRVCAGGGPWGTGPNPS